LVATVRGRFAILRDGYDFFHTLQRDNPADLYFTSIAADNDRARRLLENGARGLPKYSFLAELDTLLVAVRRRVAATPSSQAVSAAPRRPETGNLLWLSPKIPAAGRRSCIPLHVEPATPARIS